jgi:hypothetical protein
MKINNQKIIKMKRKSNILTITLITLIIFFNACKKNDTTVDNPNTPPPDNGPTIGKYTLDNQLFNCACFTDNLGYVFLRDNLNSGNTFSIDPMPTASSGTFTIGKNFTGNTTLPMGYLRDIRSAFNSYGSESGTVTKTGAREYTFSCTLYNPLTTIRYQISGNGKY